MTCTNSGCLAAVDTNSAVDDSACWCRRTSLLPRSVVLVALMSTSARAASFRPEIEVQGEATKVLVEQVGAVDVTRLGSLVGHVTPEQQWGIDEALVTVLGLR